MRATTRRGLGAGAPRPGGWGLHLRPAAHADVPAMARILKHWVTATRWMPDLHTPDQDRAFLAEQVDSAELVVADHGRIAGFVVRHGTDITMLYVAETARRLGVGSALLNRMRRDHPRLSLWTFQPNAEARAFYAARGGAGGRAHGEPRQRRTRAGCPAGLELT